MIKKLRRKFILVIMSVVTVLMIVAFVSVLAVTSRNMHRQTDFVLDNALAGLSSAAPTDNPPGHRMPSLTVITDKNGEIVAMTNQIFNLPDSAIADITNQALVTKGRSDLLLDYSLRFLLQETTSGSVQLAFVDVSMEKNMIENLLLNSALIGVSTLLAFFGASVFLSRWIVRPVEKAWNRQRQFVSDASHELKTPLTVVLSNVEMLSGDERLEDEKTRLRLDNILEESRHMKVLMDNLLQLARSDSVNLTASFKSVEFSALVNNAVLIFEPIVYDTGKRFEYNLEDQLFVTGDAIQLRQLTEILLDNACKYATPGSLITVALKKNTGKNEVCLEVTNDSETIPEEELPLVFERFYRRDKARSSGGYGLGLSIAENIAGQKAGVSLLVFNFYNTLLTVYMDLSTRNCVRNTSSIVQ